VRGAAAGEAALPRRIVADLIAEFRRRGTRDQVTAALEARGTHLTTRERQILELLADGLTSREIGERLGIALATVRSHAASVLSKLGAATRAEAVAAYKEAFRSLIGH
jgi:DNA-binding NarL/FixJ family response regulator